VRVEWVDSTEALESLRDAWERLAEPEGIPFVRHAWFLAWWRAFGTGRLAVAAAFDGEELAAVLPLERRGAQLSALANAHTPIFRPLGRADALAAAADAAVRSASSLVLPALTEAHPSLAVLREQAWSSGRTVLVQDFQRHPVVRTSGSWDDYRSRLDRKTRKDIERRRRRLDAECSPEYLVLEPPRDLETELTLGFRAEAGGWKGERRTAVLHEPAAERFYREVARAFSVEGRFRISAVAVDGAFAAFDYRRFAPGLVLTLAEIGRAFEQGLDAVELLGEAVPWKLRFADDVRPQVYLGVYRRTPASLARYGYRLVRPIVRDAYRRLPGRRAR
jgi:CelD/BcsL family acetyltransferase involved in cellulose biosynthesis